MTRKSRYLLFAFVVYAEILADMREKEHCYVESNIIVSDAPIPVLTGSKEPESESEPVGIRVDVPKANASAILAGK
jgi:hypothetical protein